MFIFLKISVFKHLFFKQSKETANKYVITIKIAIYSGKCNLVSCIHFRNGKAVHYNKPRAKN